MLHFYLITHSMCWYLFVLLTWYDMYTVYAVLCIGWFWRTVQHSWSQKNHSVVLIFADGEESHFISSETQHPFLLLPCSAGPALPVWVATHLHPSPAKQPHWLLWLSAAFYHWYQPWHGQAAWSPWCGNGRGNWLFLSMNCSSVAFKWGWDL